MRTFKTGINVDVKTAERQPRVEADPSYGYCEVKIIWKSSNHVSKQELIGSLMLGSVWVFVQLIFGPRLPMNKLNKNPNIA